VLNSTPVNLGTLTANASGQAGGSFTVPPDVAVGAHTVVLTGNSAAGAPRTVSLPLTVAVASLNTTDGGATGSSAPFPGSSGSLPITGSGGLTRDLASAGLLLLAFGMLFLGQHYRRNVAS
jgi:hypothetical protein